MPANAISADAPQIRPMQEADYDAVMAFWQGCEGVYLHNDYSETPQGFARLLARNPGLCEVATANGGIVAACVCAQDGRRGSLHHLAVAPAWRRRGIGARLAGNAIAKLRALGILRVSLGLLKDNAAGARFWQKLGFVKEDYYDVYARMDSAESKGRA